MFSSRFVETTTVSANIPSLVAIGGLMMTAVPGCKHSFAIQKFLAFIILLWFNTIDNSFFRKCTPDTLCGHGEGECRLDFCIFKNRTQKVDLKIDLSFWIQTFSSNSDCDNTGVYHICESNCLDRYFLHSKCTVGGILVTCEYFHCLVFVFVLLNSDGKHMMGGIMVTWEYESICTDWCRRWFPVEEYPNMTEANGFTTSSKYFCIFKANQFKPSVLLSFGHFHCITIGVVAATVCLTPSVLRT